MFYFLHFPISFIKAWVNLPRIMHQPCPMREENAVSAHFFVPLSLEADESLDRCAPKLYRYKELHNMIQHM